MKHIPAEGPFYEGMADLLRWYEENPDDWRATRQKLHDKYYRYKKDGYEAPVSVVSSLINGLCGVMAVLYGEGDFAKSVGIAVSAGYDCDNQAATVGGLLGVMHGASAIPEKFTHEGLPKVRWDKPFNDTYINFSRDRLPIRNSISDIVERIANIAEQAILREGGEKVMKDNEVIYKIVDNQSAASCGSHLTVWHRRLAGVRPGVSPGCEQYYLVLRGDSDVSETKRRYGRDSKEGENVTLRSVDQMYRARAACFRMSLCLVVVLGLMATAGQAEKAGSADGRNVQEVLQREARRSEPDYIGYLPRSWDGSTHDSHNEHYLVFEGPDGSLMAVWTQSLVVGEAKNRIVFSRSTDGGHTWSEPTHVVGPQAPDDPTHMASWAFPMVSRSGRIYVLYNQNHGNKGWIQMHTGTMDGVYSDDRGRTWSKPQQVPMPRSPHDDPEGKIPGEWIVWQIPMRDLEGKHFVGYTRWVNQAVTNRPDACGWTQIESVCEFVRFENIDDNPEPKDIRTSYSAWGDKSLRVPHFKYPLLSVAQEPSLVRLPDDRLFCAMRTNSGYIWYSVSSDDGRTWCNPRPLLRKDFGQPILQPVSCCPIYQMADGRYVLLHHNNRGDIESHPEATHSPRRPAFIALGEFRPNADQPIWFSRSKQFADNDNRGADGLPMGESAFPWTNIGVYGSFTTKDGNNVLWYCDRKCYLVGKRVTEDFLADLKVPSHR